MLKRPRVNDIRGRDIILFVMLATAVAFDVMTFAVVIVFAAASAPLAVFRRAFMSTGAEAAFSARFDHLATFAFAGATHVAFTLDFVAVAIVRRLAARFAGPLAASAFAGTAGVGASTIVFLMTLAIGVRAATGPARPLTAGAAVRTARAACALIFMALAIGRLAAAQTTHPETASATVLATGTASTGIIVT